jgi:hypothetical protein
LKKHKTARKELRLQNMDILPKRVNSDMLKKMENARAERFVEEALWLPLI